MVATGAELHSCGNHTLFVYFVIFCKDMKASGSRLEAITKELRFQWQQTKEHWADAKSLEFEHRFLEELFVSVDRSVSAIEQLDKLITRIKKDCE